MNSDIRVSVGLFENRKLWRFAVVLGVNRDEAAGRLLRFWVWVGAYRPDGQLAEEDFGEPTHAWTVLRECGFIDSDNTVHGWHEHNGYAAFADIRSEIARQAASHRWQRRDASIGASITCEHTKNGMHEHNAPAPSPAPAPAPNSGAGRRGKARERDGAGAPRSRASEPEGTEAEPTREPNRLLTPEERAAHIARIQALARAAEPDP